MIPLRSFLIIVAAFFTLAAHAGEKTPSVLLLGGALAGDHIIVVGERGAIFSSEDSGDTWQKSVSPTSTALTAVSFTEDGKHGWAVGHDATILATRDAGATWQLVYQGDNQEDSFLDVCVVTPDTIIAVGAYGYYVESRDAGKTWQSRWIQDEDSHLNRITKSSGNILYVAGERGTLLRSNNLGKSWRSIASPYRGSFYGILSLPSGRLIAHGLRGHIYTSNNEGEDWKLTPIDQHPLLAAGYHLSSGEIVLAGQPRAFLVSHDKGKTFAPWAVSLTTGISTLLQAPDGRFLALGEAGIVTLPSF